MPELERAPLPSETTDGLSPEVPAPALPGLVVSGLVVAKADLIAALRLYHPHIVDLTPLPDGRYVLEVGHPEGGAS